MYSKIGLINILLIFDLILSCSTIFTKDKLSIDELLFCKLQPNGFPCHQKSISKFYFDTVLKTCSTFEYGNCEYSYNEFDTLHECNTICFKSLYHDFRVMKNLSADIVCHLQPEFGDCFKYYPMYYFDVSTHMCQGFSYSGCGGNGNKFLDELTCKKTCTDWIPIPKMGSPDRNLTKTIFKISNLTWSGNLPPLITQSSIEY